MPTLESLTCGWTRKGAGSFRGCFTLKLPRWWVKGCYKWFTNRLNGVSWFLSGPPTSKAYFRDLSAHLHWDMGSVEIKHAVSSNHIIMSMLTPCPPVLALNLVTPGVRQGSHLNTRFVYLAFSRSHDLVASQKPWRAKQTWDLWLAKGQKSDWLSVLSRVIVNIIVERCTHKKYVASHVFPVCVLLIRGTSPLHTVALHDASTLKS